MTNTPNTNIRSDFDDILADLHNILDDNSLNLDEMIALRESLDFAINIFKK